MGVVAVPFCHIIAGGPGFRGALPHATWAGAAAAAGRKPQAHLSLELRELFPHLSLTAVPGHGLFLGTAFRMAERGGNEEIINLNGCCSHRGED